MLKQNLEATEKALGILRKIHSDVWWRRIFGIAKFAIVIVLLIFSYLKLEPLFADLLTSYDKILNPR